jgi:hypothetical protein
LNPKAISNNFNMAEKTNYFDLAPEFRRGVANGYLAETVLNVSRLDFVDQIRTNGLTHLPSQPSNSSSDFDREYYVAKYCLNSLKQHIPAAHNMSQPIAPVAGDLIQCRIA